VEVVDGNKGELSVLVDGRVVAEKGPEGMPDPQKVLEAVRHTAAPVGG
jgi:hypothetical protein